MIPWPSGPSRPRTDPGVVDVWAADLDGLSHAFPNPETQLVPGEVDRARRFVRDGDRRRWTMARAILRVLLGRYLETHPTAVSFRYAPEGKLSLYGSDPLRFNVSHSGRIALYAITSGIEVGVDVETNRPIRALEGVARRFFSPAEFRELRRLPIGAIRDGFYRGWTRKEAILKATGQGLSGDPCAFDVTLDPGAPPRLLRMDVALGRTVAWSLFHLDPAPGTVGALAARGPGTTLRTWRIDGRAPRSVAKVPHVTVVRAVGALRRCDTSPSAHGKLPCLEAER